MTFSILGTEPKVAGHQMLVFYPHGNEQGSPEFEREAKKFSSLYLVPKDQIVSVPDMADRDFRRRAVISNIRKHKPGKINAVVFFCHGWTTGFWFGWNHFNVTELADHLNTVCTVVLYSCLTGGGPDVDLDEPGTGAEGGFADKLRDALEARGKTGSIVAHTTAGHTTWNPFAIRLISSGDPAKRGDTVAFVSKSSKMWQRWRDRLKMSTFRYYYPFLSHFELVELLDLDDRQFWLHCARI